MRKTHTMGPDGDDAAAPRLTAFTISKGIELNNPLDPASGETGNLLYIMDESYIAKEGIGSHMALAVKEMFGDMNLLEKLQELGKKYSHFMEVGSCAVFTNIGYGAIPN